MKPGKIESTPERGIMKQAGRSVEDFTGRKNMYQCDTCGGVIVTVHRQHGVTPMFLNCRATNGCAGSMASAMYAPVPEMFTPTHEWYVPTVDELQQMNREMREHIEQGGLMIRKVTPFRSWRDEMTASLLKKGR